MKYTAEYGSYPESQASTKSLLDTRVGHNGRRLVLYRSTQGYEPAGSCARWTGEKYTAGFYDQNGTFYGRSFSDEARARAHFYNLV
jgi:hypothetical protein